MSKSKEGASSRVDTHNDQFSERLELVSLRPKLMQGICKRSIGDSVELFCSDTNRVIPIDSEHELLLNYFDGETSVAELVVAGLGDRGFALGAVLTLLDRLISAEMLDSDVVPAQWHAAIDHIAKLALVSGVSGSSRRSMQKGEQVEVTIEDESSWKPLTKTIEDRASFLREIDLFENFDDEVLGRLAELAHEETWPAASDIVSEGGRADRLFIIRSGEVNIVKEDPNGGRSRVSTLKPKEWFGDVGLRDRQPRNATARACLSKPVQLLSFDEGVFEQLIQPYIEQDDDALELSRRQEELSRVPLFRALAPSDLKHVARALKTLKVKKGSVLFSQNEKADKFYVIVSGSVGVIRDSVPIARLTAGEFFGETALLFTQERTATIVATEDCVLWVLDSATFTELVRDVLLHTHNMMPTVIGRINSTDPV